MDIPQLAFIMDSVGIGEWVVLLVVVMIVVGPQRLPEMARKMGRWAETFRRAADEFKRQIMTMDEEPHKQEPDYMDYTKGEPENYSSGESYLEPVTEAGETTPETISPSETEISEYRDSYPSEGLPTPEQTELHEEPAAGMKTEGEQKS